MRTRAASQSGFTYLAILFAVAIMGALLGATGLVWKTVSQRDKEAQLLAIGHEFRAAITQYYDNTPGAAKQYPKKLEDLLEDKRFPTIRRYLRKVYVDPLTGKKEWGIVAGPTGTIMGVYSLSDARPIKTANFEEADKTFEGAASFETWAFTHKPGVAPTPAAAPAPGASPVTPQVVPPNPLVTVTPAPAAPPPGGEITTQ